MSASVVVTLAAALYWARLPTYEVVAQPTTTASAFWNDDQLVVFVPASYIGRSTTNFDRTRAAACKRFGNSAFKFFCDGFRRTSDLGRGINIVRYERGVVSRMLVDDNGTFGPNAKNPSRFFEGRLYVLGGVWTGRALEWVPIEQQARVYAAPGSNDLSPWHVALTLEGDVPVRLRGEAMILRARRGPGFGQFVVELLHPPQPPLHLWSAKLGGKPAAMSEQEFRQVMKTNR